ncbi:phosphodiester glycosidase family protein [Deinococcus roseus]|uniref:Phosphodiester glycosidase domain-containing protein n=1 Tax=Deinococcus roseus TaxID=392414 RepID=A0ABQ2DD73_9DEIO|nr:phosphodiester glycosidase family protein [Deinococcus roseus]GGJ53954.1 hypothetical protein GCM10008938_44980 [Deinococcus roseus]
MRSRVFAVALLLFLNSAHARPVYLAGQNARTQTRTLQGQEVLPLEGLVLLGVQVNQDRQTIELVFQNNRFVFKSGSGWEGATLPGLVFEQGKWYVPLAVLDALGFRALNNLPELLDYAALPVVVPAAQPVETAQTSPAPMLPEPVPNPEVPQVVLPQFQGIRHSVQIEEYTERTRIVLDLSAPTQYEVKDNKITLFATQGQNLAQAIAGSKGVKGIRVEQNAQGMRASLTLSRDAEFKVFPLQNPPRVVIDVFQFVRPVTPPFPNLSSLPAGVSYQKLGDLELLTFQRSQFQPKLTSGFLQGVETFVKQGQAVAGINGGYFDMKTGFPVDMVVKEGRLLFGGLEKRAAVGFTSSGDLMWGIPKARYTLSTPLGQERVNSVRSGPRDGWLTLFVGDGKNVVGGKNFVTLTVQDGVVTRVSTGAFKAAEGEITVTFQPEKHPILPTKVGATVGVSVAWTDESWLTARDVLAAGPMLVKDSQYAVNAVQEDFDTGASVWRPTRQVAFGTTGAGDYVFAYLKWGTPEDFARALLKAGLKQAMRLDSGTSATVFVSGGFLNRTWSRPVPNAILMVPRLTTAQK